MSSDVFQLALSISAHQARNGPRTSACFLAHSSRIGLPTIRIVYHCDPYYTTVPIWEQVTNVTLTLLSIASLCSGVKLRSAREIVAVLRPSKALQSPSAAFGKFINPTLNGRHATRRTLWPPKRFWVSFCYESPASAASQATQNRPSRLPVGAVVSPSLTAPTAPVPTWDRPMGASLRDLALLLPDVNFQRHPQVCFFKVPRSVL